MLLWRTLQTLWDGGHWNELVTAWGSCCIGVALATWPAPSAALPVAGIGLLVVLPASPVLFALLQVLVRTSPGTETAAGRLAHTAAQALTHPRLGWLRTQVDRLALVLLVGMTAVALLAAHPLLVIFTPLPLRWRQQCIRLAAFIRRTTDDEGRTTNDG